MAFAILPALHLDGGLVREKPDAVAPELLARLARAHGEIVVVDVAGIHRNEPDLASLQAAARNRVLWMDAGSRTLADVSDLFIAGASRVTARWNTLADAKELEDAAEVAEELYLGVEVATTFVQNRRDPAPASRLARIAEKHGLRVVLIDLGASGAPSAPTLAVGREFVHAPERWYMGNATRDSVAFLEQEGYTGAILPIDAFDAVGETA